MHRSIFPVTNPKTKAKSKGWRERKRLYTTPNYLLFGSIHSYNLPQNTLDKLKLCDPNYLELANELIEIMVKKATIKTQYKRAIPSPVYLSKKE